jgi:hypothetical protein
MHHIHLAPTTCIAKYKLKLCQVLILNWKNDAPDDVSYSTGVQQSFEFTASKRDRSYTVSFNVADGVCVLDSGEPDDPQTITLKASDTETTHTIKLTINSKEMVRIECVVATVGGGSAAAQPVALEPQSIRVNRISLAPAQSHGPSSLLEKQWEIKLQFKTNGADGSAGSASFTPTMTFTDTGQNLTELKHLTDNRAAFNKLLGKRYDLYVTIHELPHLQPSTLPHNDAVQDLHCFCFCNLACCLHGRTAL